jgi:hypothetical protein
MVVSDKAVESISIRHANVSREAFDHGTARILGGFESLESVLAQWQTINLSDEKRTEFATRAARLRWSEGGPLSPFTLLTPRRMADYGTDLWRTLNVVQEHLLRGQDRYFSGFQRATTRPVTGIAQGIELNRGLWSLAEEFSRN